MKKSRIHFTRLLWIYLVLAGTGARADKTYFALDGVFFRKEGSTNNIQQLRGYFSWTYTPGNFENGTGEFLNLDIPGTAHNHTDLESTFDTGSIEITLAGSVHDDGVDISLHLLTPLSPDGSASIDTDHSKFDIGGNGFYSGTVFSGRVKPFEFKLNIESTGPKTASVSWEPDYPGGGFLEQSPTLAPGSWDEAIAGNPLSVTTTGTSMFYRLQLP